MVSKASDWSGTRDMGSKGEGWHVYVILFWMAFGLGYLPHQMMFTVASPRRFTLMFIVGWPLERPNVMRTRFGWRFGIGPFAWRVEGGYRRAAQ